ncbi:putative cupredoxin [Medicago truncatula]|uniref:Plastocyanin-like domain protein n=1 Tax=Medicago truncatula TaxID=3880 RepID=G7IJN7_MEDTR|nr:early nodulin-like protein 3 [Medicago truncatula]AES66907.1 plastocyanin-like domain protein [Medicago truncatula]RHN75295.1 putative cupredoxin [Medicago truncatula]
MATIVQALVLFCLLVLLMHKGDAYEFVVGGQKGWSAPSDPNANPYNQWAEKSRFQVGDSLVFNYQSGQDSVIQVTSQQDYENCNTDASSEKSSDGHTVIKLIKSGPHYFISGNKNNCLQNEKLLVIVLADRTNKNSNQTTSPPSPSPSVAPSPSPLSSHSSDALTPIPPPSPLNGSSTPPSPVLDGSSPPPSPLDGSTLTPPPVQQVGSSPPPLGTDVTNPITPTQSPVSEPPPPNAASSILVSFGCSVGALMVSLLVFSK